MSNRIETSDPRHRQRLLLPANDDTAVPLDRALRDNGNAKASHLAAAERETAAPCKKSKSPTSADKPMGRLEELVIVALLACVLAMLLVGLGLMLFLLLDSGRDLAGRFRRAPLASSPGDYALEIPLARQAEPDCHEHSTSWSPGPRLSRSIRRAMSGLVHVFQTATSTYGLFDS